MTKSNKLTNRFKVPPKPKKDPVKDIIERVINQSAAEVETWPKWVKRNCESVFGKNK